MSLIFSIFTYKSNGLKSDHMKESAKNLRLKNSLKNTRAKLSRRDKKIAELESKIAQLEEESKKKDSSLNVECVSQSLEKKFSDTNSQNLLFDIPSLSDAKQTAALEILSRLLKS